MTQAIIVEDGSNPAGANSYATLAKVVAYNLQRGTDMTDEDDDTVVALMTQALDFLEGYEERWKGDRAFPLIQQLSWPRANLTLFGSVVPVNMVPTIIVNAQAYLTGVAYSGVDLAAVQDTRAIIKEVIGPLETDYSPTAGATVRPMVPLLDAMLLPLLKTSVGGLRSLRI